MSTPTRRIARRRAPRGRVLVPAAALAAALCVPALAHARKPDIKRRGGQISGVIGGSLCVPGSKVDCSVAGVPGKIAPSFGLGIDAGYRLNKFFFIGAGYQLGLFNPTLDLGEGRLYKTGVQNSILVVPRFTLPAWRFDFGLAWGLGFSRQAFGGTDVSLVDKTYTQGFAMRPEVSIDVWITKRVFIGVRGNIVLNAHNVACDVVGSTTTCHTKSRADNIAGVHQSLIGLHVGGTFF